MTRSGSPGRRKNALVAYLRPEYALRQIDRADQLSHGIARYLELAPLFRGADLVEKNACQRSVGRSAELHHGIVLEIEGRVIVGEVEGDVLTLQAGGILYLQRSSADDVDSGLGDDFGVFPDLQPAAIVARRYVLAVVDLDAVEIASSHGRRLAHLQRIVEDRAVGLRGRHEERGVPFIAAGRARRRRDQETELPRAQAVGALGVGLHEAFGSGDASELVEFERAVVALVEAENAELGRPEDICLCRDDDRIWPQTSAGRNVFVCMEISTRLAAFSLSSVISTLCGAVREADFLQKHLGARNPDLLQRAEILDEEVHLLADRESGRIRDRLHSGPLVVDGGAVHSQTSDGDENRE